MKAEKGWGMAQVVEGNQEALSSNSSTATKKDIINFINMNRTRTRDIKSNHCSLKESESLENEILRSLTLTRL
jgi:hypothetical protein